MLETAINNNFSQSELVGLLNSEGEKTTSLFTKAARAKQHYVGNRVYLRGLIELSNICEKDCYYCGIRKSNRKVKHYSISETEVLEAVKFAYENGFGSVAIQSGEMKSDGFTEKIDRIVRQTKQISNGELGITLSCGEQTAETYARWRESGADRYLLRIEASNPELYRKLHPSNPKHAFENRISALETLKKLNYQVGTGVMIGLPFQTTEDLANDLLFMKKIGIVMCGMGPYLEHQETPLYQYKNSLLPLSERLQLSLKMVAVLRILMPDINIAATTALQSIDKNARMQAVCIGANVLMPNITPKQYRDDYFLYENKPVSTQSDEDDLHSLENQLKIIRHKIGYFGQGNAPRYERK